LSLLLSLAAQHSLVSADEFQIVTEIAISRRARSVARMETTLYSGARRQIRQRILIHYKQCPIKVDAGDAVALVSFVK